MDTYLLIWAHIYSKELLEYKNRLGNCEKNKLNLDVTIGYIGMTKRPAILNRKMCAFNAVGGLAIKVNTQLYYGNPRESSKVCSSFTHKVVFVHARLGKCKVKLLFYHSSLELKLWHSDNLIYIYILSIVFCLD